MDPTITDYQGSALYGDAPNTSALNATMLNPNAASPSDWTTILTSGISSAAINGINGAVNNAIVAGQVSNAITAKNGGLPVSSIGVMTKPISPTELIIGALIIYLLMK